jgi:hypothetical protein
MNRTAANASYPGFPAKIDINPEGVAQAVEPARQQKRNPFRVRSRCWNESQGGPDHRSSRRCPVGQPWAVLQNAFSVILLRTSLGLRSVTVTLTALLLLAGCSSSGNKDDASDISTNAIEGSAEKGPVKLHVRVSPREPRLSDLVEMDVTVEAQPEVDIKPPAFGQAVGDFLIRDYSERPAPAGTQNVRRFHYQLEPVHAGKHLIRSVSIEFVDKRPSSENRGEAVLIETEPIEVNVTSELGDETPSLTNLEPMLPPQPLPRSPWTGWLGVCVLVVVLIGVWLGMRCKRRKREILPRRQTPEEIAHAALAALLSENLPARGLLKEFYLRLTGIVRQYIEDTTGIRAPEQTTEEFLRDMHSREAFPADRSVRLAEFLEAADMVKYAGQQPGSGQIDEAILRAREFVAMRAVPAAAT